MTKRGEPQRYFREVVMTYDGDDCLTWPFNRGGNGYGQLYYEGRPQPVSRIICKEKYGPAPTPRYEAAHSCGRGKFGCVTKAHLSWKTHKENEADKLLHGTSNRGKRHGSASITEADVAEIRSLKGKVFQRDLAARFGVVQQHISRIQCGKQWIA